jgi:hypothetical protein
MLTALHPGRNVLRNMLLAPAVGLSTTLLLEFLLSRAGLAVERFGVGLSACLVGAAVITFLRLRPPFAARQYLPFALVLVMGALLVAWPMFMFGFNWVSYANDDMADYALMAQRYLHNGFFSEPDLGQMLSGRDYSLYYWLLTGPGMWRSGVDLTLAWIASITDLTSAELYMPVIVSFQVALISALGALVTETRRRRTVALVSCALLAASAMATLGVMYQLAPQTGGLALLCAATTLFVESLRPARVRQAFGASALLAIVVSAMLLMYPELTPFLVLGGGLYVAILLFQRRLALRQVFRNELIAICALVLVLNVQLVYAIVFLINQLGAGLSANLQPCSDDLSRVCNGMDSLFPYFLVPSGLADLWGFHVISGGWVELASVGIEGGC